MTTGGLLPRAGEERQGGLRAGEILWGYNRDEGSGVAGSSPGPTGEPSPGTERIMDV